MDEYIFWAICIFWGAYGAIGVVMTVFKGKGDINWWIWPPVALTILPLAILKLLFDIQTAKTGTIILNGVVVLAAIIVWFAGRKKPS